MSIVGAFVMPHPPLIIPDVGRGREKGIQATIDACDEVGRRIAALKPQTIVISSPHATMYRDYFHISPGRYARGDFGMYRAPHAAYEAQYDMRLVAKTCALCKREGLSAGTDYERDARLDHGTMIALHFIERHYKGFEVVRLGLSGQSPADHYRMGRCVQQAAEQLGRRVVWLASGDLSHKLLEDGPYGFAPEGPQFDKRITDDFARGDLVDVLAVDPSLAERAAECGLRSFMMMVGALDGMEVRSELLSYEGPFGVGYGVAAFTPVDACANAAHTDRLSAYLALRSDELRKRKEQEDAFVRLARLSLETFVRERRRIEAGEDVPDELKNTRAGCFVSLKIDGALRGCIGTIEPTRDTLAMEICANAISAGTRDPRFLPVRVEELDELVYDVDVLTSPEPIDDASALDPARYGVIVSCADGRRRLLLPDLDGVDTVEEQLRIAAQKGRIDLDYDDYRLERFEVVRHL